MGKTIGELTEEFKSDMRDFRDMTAKFYAKEVKAGEYKGFSGGFGSYAQRGGTASMLRLRMPGGRVTKEKLKFLADAVREHEVGRIHITTCQSVQFHDLDEKSVCDIMEAAMDVGILTRGGGGDFPRNTMVSPLSGVEKGEYFDVLPYAEKVSDYLMGMIKNVKLPRKLKVGFSNSPANVTHATYRDLGFVAREDGTFDVYSAGGLGNNPRIGVKVGEKIAPSEILFYVKAMAATFVAYGNYENRGKARTRYMQETLGVDGYRAAYQEKLKEIREKNSDGFYEGGTFAGLDEEEKLTLRVKEASAAKKGNGVALYDSRAVAQKQEGLYAVAYHPVGGMVPPEKFGEIYELIKDMEAVEVRIAPDETLYVINLDGSEAKKVLSITADGAKNLFETSVSCIGSNVCQIGLRDSQGLLAAIIAAVDKYSFADGVLPRIHISGCTSSCGTHQTGALGFHGSSKKVNGRPQPAFSFHVNGCELEGGERFGEEWGTMLTEDIPRFFVELGQEISGKAMTFDEWYAKNPERLRQIAEKYLQ